MNGEGVGSSSTGGGTDLENFMEMEEAKQPTRTDTEATLRMDEDTIEKIASSMKQGASTEQESAKQETANKASDMSPSNLQLCRAVHLDPAGTPSPDPNQNPQVPQPEPASDQNPQVPQAEPASDQNRSHRFPSQQSPHPIRSHRFPSQQSPHPIRSRRFPIQQQILHPIRSRRFPIQQIPHPIRSRRFPSPHPHPIRSRRFPSPHPHPSSKAMSSSRHQVA